jgi:hypothetical protein
MQQAVNEKRLFMKNITIKGARLHNLQYIDLSIPKNELVVVTVSADQANQALYLILFSRKGASNICKLLVYLQALMTRKSLTASRVWVRLLLYSKISFARATPVQRLAQEPE